MSKLNKDDIGVIVGRFQVPALHEAHQALIREVCARHNNRVIIFVGVSPTLCTKEHPLDYPTRKLMIESAFPNVVVLPQMDQARDEVWSKNLDNAIRTVYPLGEVCLYGGRDSFVKSYKGRFPAHEFPTHDYRPGSEIRAEVGKTPIDSEDFRRGYIYATQNQYKRTHCTVDVCIYKKEDLKEGAKRDPNIEILLGRKPNETKYRLIGGFVEGEPLEEAARREAGEEANVALEGPMEFVGSLIINDWRYGRTSDSVLTTLFASEYTWGGGLTDKEEKAGDDLEELRWFDLKKVYTEREDLVVHTHRTLIEKLAEYFDCKPKKGDK